MAYKITPWEYSNTVIEDEAQFTDGPKTIKILEAQFFDSLQDEKIRNTYKLQVECIEEGVSCGARATLTYWLKDSKTGQDNKNTLGTLSSLGQAIFGEDFKGLPAPCDIKGAVCIADIRMKTADTGRSFPRVYRFLSASEDFSVYSDIEQYFRKVAPAPRQV